jgi:hypothetical protein
MRVLILGPWPITRPRHGGQIRAASIVAAYRARGHAAMFIGIFDPGNVPPADATPDDVAIDDAVMGFIGRSGQRWELSLWRAFAEEPALFARFEAAVRRFGPDVVQFEEPYLWPVVRALRQHGRLGNAPVVHSSYNFETDYRRDLAEIAGNVDEALLGEVARQEAEIARESDLVATVSDADADSFRRVGARHVVVARNGSRPPAPTEAALAAVDAYLGDVPFALFVSSAHPPNAQGLLDLAAGAASGLPGPLLICGAVHRLLEPGRTRHRLIRDARMLGTVDPEVLDALLVRAAVILLPKTRGGGSNLKTSEALLARRPVVATTLAFAGFEGWRDEPGVAVADEPARFWKLAADALADPQPIVAPSGHDPRDDLLWTTCLAPMIDAAEALAAGGG